MRRAIRYIISSCLLYIFSKNQLLKPTTGFYFSDIATGYAGDTKGSRGNAKGEGDGLRESALQQLLNTGADHG